jgi:uncharacterized OsmC-like protein
MDAVEAQHDVILPLSDFIAKLLMLFNARRTMAQAEVREYAARASSTDTFGRVMCNSRDHYFVVDGPVQNGCPGEAITPAELFLAGVACCGVELVQVLAKSKTIPLGGIAVDIQGSFDRSRPVRPDVTLFNSVHLHFRMKGVTEQQGGLLVEGFKGR